MFVLQDNKEMGGFISLCHFLCYTEYQPRLIIKPREYPTYHKKEGWSGFCWMKCLTATKSESLGFLVKGDGGVFDALHKVVCGQHTDSWSFFAHIHFIKYWKWFSSELAARHILTIWGTCLCSFLQLMGTKYYHNVMS